MHSNGILNDILGGGTDEKLEIKDAKRCILRYLKRCFGSWHCRETFENQDAKWCFLAVFKTIIFKLEPRRFF